jgi:hypothetical protein
LGLKVAPRRRGFDGSWVLVGLAAGLATAVAIWESRFVVDVGRLGLDYGFYRDLGARVLAGGPLYLPHQLAGPYDVGLVVDNLYPPPALALFIAAALTPWLLWWLIPIAVTAYVVRGYRPAPSGIAAILVLLAWPRAVGAVLYGNTDMWVMAGVAAGLRFGWPAALVILKPVFAPLALVGIRHRSWWLALGAGVLSVILFWPLWSDYLTAMANLRIDSLYSLGSVPLLLIPLVAWLTAGSRRGASSERPSSDGFQDAVDRATSVEAASGDEVPNVGGLQPE